MNMVICDFCGKEIGNHEDKKVITLEIKEPCSIIPTVKKLDFHSKCADVLKNKFDRLKDGDEVKHGKWIKLKNKFYSSSNGKSGNIVKCSICEEQSPCGLGTPYCSICGAKMDVRRNTQ